MRGWTARAPTGQPRTGYDASLFGGPWNPDELDEGFVEAIHADSVERPSVRISKSRSFTGLQDDGPRADLRNAAI